MNLAHVRHVILDRDGVLNEEAPQSGYVRHPDDWRWVPGSLEAVVLLALPDLRISIATNQSGVGRGIMTSEQLVAVHNRMICDVTERGGRIDAIFVCPHAPDEHCSCRKPLPGLLIAAVEAAGVSRSGTMMIGDAVRDVEAARAAGIEVAIALTGKGASTVAKPSMASVPQYSNLLAFVAELRRARGL